MEINKDIINIKQAEIARRINYIIDNEYGITPTEFACRVGIDPSGLIKMLKGQAKITKNTVRKLCDALSLSMDWIVFGEGDLHVEDVDILVPKISYTEGVPYYDEDFLLGFDEIVAPNNENPDFLVRMPGYERATLWCNASGHSMEPEINNGDKIALQRIEDFSFLPFGDVYGFITTNGMRTIKRLGRSSKEGYYRLIPTNRDYDEQEIPISKIACVYRVMGTMKSF